MSGFGATYELIKTYEFIKTRTVMSEQQTQITHLAAQVEALKIVISMIDTTLEARGMDRRGVMIEAFDQAVSVLKTKQHNPAHKRALLVVKEMQIYLCAPGPVSAAMVKRQLAEDERA